MNKRQVDVAVIGAGSAGLTAFRAAKQWTDNVLLIEGGPYGTTCARVGCMPSKLLIAAAEAAHAAQQAGDFGVRVDNVAVDGVAVMNRVRSERDRFVGFVVDGVENIPAEQRLRGYARFIDDHHLQVDDHTIVEAKRVVIATGSRPAIPAIFDNLGERLLVNDDIFDWTDLPSSIAVFGPGVIGLELGQALSRLGVDVLMFGRGGGLGPLSDPAVRASALESFSKAFTLDLDADVSDMKRVGDAVEISFRGPDGELVTRRVDYVLAATGRTPNLEKLGLENTSLSLDDSGIPVFDVETLQVGDTHVFIAGDVNNDRPLLHEAADEGRIAGSNAGRYPDIQTGLRSSPLGIVFTEPQIGTIGTRYTDLDENQIVIGEVSFVDQGRSRVMLRNEGLLRVYADKQSGRFLGAEMFGPRAEHIAHLLAWAHQSQLTVRQILEMPFYHPVIEEGVRTAIREAARQVDSKALKAA